MGVPQLNSSRGHDRPGRQRSRRAWLIAIFVALAMLLGGGGSPSPGMELLLQLVFAGFFLAWIWLSSDDSTHVPDPWILVLVAVPVLLPLVQLVPLPPSIWTSLPGREDELASLALVGAESSWRPISLSTSRTVAALLATIPAVFCVYAVASLNDAGRRLVLKSILLVALASIALGIEQVVAGRSGLSFYSHHHVGWVTGFQANRNHEANVLHIGLLALAALVAVNISGMKTEHIFGLTRQAFRNASIAFAGLIVTATVMTGSRTGTLLIVVVILAAIGIFYAAKAAHGKPASARWYFWALLAGFAVLVVGFFSLVRNTAVARVAERFVDLTDTRSSIWEDAWFAAERFWPVGVGMGGFQPAIVASERLGAVSPGYPNRAHNDYLELAIEAGYLGVVALLAVTAACLFLAWRSWRDSPRSRPYVAFGLGALVILALHSVVDYPMRSMAIACLAGVAGGMLSRTMPRAGDLPSEIGTRNMKGSK